LNNNATTTYTFTPTAGQCATTSQLTITVNPSVTPTLNPVAPICSGAPLPALPTTSLNNITGAWSPALNNTATTTYTFTPTVGQCATTAQLTITVNPSVTPAFVAIGPLCQNSLAPPLPMTSSNGINGTWSPAVINTAITGSSVYTFTPVSGYCAVNATMNVTIRSSLTLNITNPPEACSPSTVDLTDPVITSGSDPGLVYSYWKDVGATTPLINPSAVTASGTYYIKATAVGNCSLIQVMPVVVTVKPEMKPMRYQTLTATPNVPLQLVARNIGNNSTYTWLPPAGLNSSSVKAPVFNYDRRTEYLITISDGSCRVVDTLLIKIEAVSPGCDPGIFVPTAWSPNGDGHNDKLFPLTTCIRELKYFRIYDRWGKLMFETNVIGNGWDGTFRNQGQVPDVYSWILHAVGQDGRDIKRTGNAALLR
jgi:gliding motility-associated-like protein